MSVTGDIWRAIWARKNSKGYNAAFAFMPINLMVNKLRDIRQRGDGWTFSGMLGHALFVLTLPITAPITFAFSVTAFAISTLATVLFTGWVDLFSSCCGKPSDSDAQERRDGRVPPARDINYEYNSVAAVNTVMNQQSPPPSYERHLATNRAAAYTPQLIIDPTQTLHYGEQPIGNPVLITNQYGQATVVGYSNNMGVTYFNQAQEAQTTRPEQQTGYRPQ